MKTPYIGIAGITSREQIDAIVDGYPDDAPPLAMGVLGSYKTLILRQSNKYPNRYPAWHELPGLWSDRGNVAVTLHYSFAEDDTAPARTTPQLEDELYQARALADSALWIQVNARPMIQPWHAAVLARVALRSIRLIVQVSARAMEQWRATVHYPFGNVMRDVLAPLHPHREKITLLFDASGGKGIQVDVDRIAPLIQFCHSAGFSCGTAGALSPDNLHRLRPLFDICPLSVDTESWPRDADDRLDIAKARAFRDAAMELYR